MGVDMKVKAIYDSEIGNITRSEKSWKDVLKVAGQLYRYEFDNIVMVTAQRPPEKSTLMADYDTWKKVGRYVKRGAKGCAIFPSRALNPRMRYIFDISDTGGKNVKLTYRATNQSRIMGDCTGSKKQYSFRLTAENTGEVHLFECAIDLLSYATLMKLEGKDWRQFNLVSLAGVYSPKQKIEDSKVPVTLGRLLEKDKTIRRIVLHLDNDIAGRKATKALQTILSDKYEVFDDPPKYGKDVNDFLCKRLGIKDKTERSFAR